MFCKIVAVFLMLATAAHCESYGGGSSGGSSYGGHESYGHSVDLAIHSNHQVSHHEVKSSGYTKPTNVEVGPSVIPINVLFRTQSSPMHVQQVHHSAGGSHQESHSQDEPHKLVHTVTKPIYQEVIEIVQPYRKIMQEIKPVQEQVETLVAKHAGHSEGYGGGYGGSEGGYGKMESYGHMSGGYGGSEGGYGKMESYGGSEGYGDSKGYSGDSMESLGALGTLVHGLVYGGMQGGYGQAY